MRVPTTINPGPRSTDLERLDQEIESHPIWTELRGPVTSSTTLLDTDGQGNITSLLNAGETSASCAANYDPFGAPILGSSPPVNGNGICDNGSAASTTGNDLWYRSQSLSPTGGSYQLGARTYNPSTGTFTTPDGYRVDTPGQDLSVGTDPLTANTYSYVNGNPVNFSDPSGHGCVHADDLSCGQTCGGTCGPPALPVTAGSPGHPCTELEDQVWVTASGNPCNIGAPYVPNPPPFAGKGGFCKGNDCTVNSRAGETYCALYNGNICSNGRPVDAGEVQDESGLMTAGAICVVTLGGCAVAFGANDFGHCTSSTANCLARAAVTAGLVYGSGKVLEWVGGKLVARTRVARATDPEDLNIPRAIPPSRDAPRATPPVRDGAPDIPGGAPNSGGPPLLRARPTGSGPRMPMNMQCVCEVAGKYGIDISDVQITIDKGRMGFQGITGPTQLVTLARDAFANEETLARTLYHESVHVSDLRAGMPYPMTESATDAWESRAYGLENEWWANHPLNSGNLP